MFKKHNRIIRFMSVPLTSIFVAIKGSYQTESIIKEESKSDKVELLFFDTFMHMITLILQFPLFKKIQKNIIGNTT